LLNHVEQLLKTKFICPIKILQTLLQSNRNGQTIRSLSQLYNHGRMGGTGYLSILPVDQGIEHTAGSSFTPNPIYFDPENSIKLAMEGCNAIVSTMGGLALFSRKYAHKIPFVVKLNQRITDLSQEIRPNNVWERESLEHGSYSCRSNGIF
jgi:class I fructose-bisphosphate aldolase